MSASAIIPVPGVEEALAPLNIERALALVRDSRDLRELAELRDQAKLLQGLARTRDASLETQQAAGEVKLRAEWRMGKLLGEQQETGERQRRGDAGRAAANAPKAAAQPLVDQPKPKTLEDLGIKKDLAAKARQVAKQPEAKLDGYIEAARTHGTEITTAGLVQFASRRNPHAASNVNSARAQDAPPTEPDKNDRFTPEWWVRELKERWKLNRDIAGHELAPATKVFGKKNVWTAEDDCFAQDLTGVRGLGNWPWDSLNRFVPWAWLKVATGEAELIAQPLPSGRFSQRWAQEFVEPFRPDQGGSGVRIHFPLGRIGYGTVLDPLGERKDNAPGNESAAVIFEGPFVRSPDVQPAGTIDEVIAEVRQHFAEDRRFFGGEAVGWEHLWRQALQLARGEVPEPRASTAPLGSLLIPERFAQEAKPLGFKVTWKGRTLRATCTRGRCGGELKFLLTSHEELIPRAKLEQLQEHARSHVGKPAKKKGKR